MDGIESAQNSATATTCGRMIAQPFMYIAAQVASPRSPVQRQTLPGTPAEHRIRPEVHVATIGAWKSAKPTAMAPATAAVTARLRRRVRAVKA